MNRKKVQPPLINWDVLQRLNMPERPEPPAPAPGDADNMWDRTSEMYSRMTELEGKFTLDQLDCIPIEKGDTVLDVCCGPGRIAVPAAKRARSVTGIDSSSKMLDYCRIHAQQESVTNLEIKYMDWNEAEPGRNLDVHDIVIACRCTAMGEIEKLSACARKYAAIVCWANAPSIPEILGDLFEGAVQGKVFRPRQNDRRAGYNIFYNKIYDLGYDPNCRILDDGYYSVYRTKEDAYKDLRVLAQQKIIYEKQYHSNVDKFLTKNSDGTFTFLHKTRSFVMWWDTRI